MPKKRDPNAPVEGPFKELARLVRDAIGDLSYRAVQIKTGVNHMTVQNLWHGHRADVESIVKLARGLGVLPNILLVAADHRPIHGGGDIVDVDMLPSIAGVNSDGSFQINPEDPGPTWVWKFANGQTVRLSGLPSPTSDPVWEQEYLKTTVPPELLPPDMRPDKSPIRTGSKSSSGSTRSADEPQYIPDPDYLPVPEGYRDEFHELDEEGRRDVENAIEAAIITALNRQRKRSSIGQNFTSTGRPTNARKRGRDQRQ